ncbi:uncharacterized protein TM35_000084650 [Trypanosoma theileri]|uniref:Uncharacterized protein n=1 Tax=Trypanosoma theileri TaxID=67003 RepID=A0A1X0P159_9TRYP|nr:uncharacterized protein TM35_000084650 [Trypanosoma theileri]ORC90667.1 hypothetical protein TM35_000084650 [Trypanosoma theileri]
MRSTRSFTASEEAPRTAYLGKKTFKIWTLRRGATCDGEGRRRGKRVSQHFHFHPFRCLFAGATLVVEKKKSGCARAVASKRGFQDDKVKHCFLFVFLFMK